MMSIRQATYQVNAESQAVPSGGAVYEAVHWSISSDQSTK